MIYGTGIGHKYVFVATHISRLLEDHETYDFLQKLKHSSAEELDQWYTLLNEEVMKCPKKRSTRKTKKSRSSKG